MEKQWLEKQGNESLEGEKDKSPTQLLCCMCCSCRVSAAVEFAMEFVDGLDNNDVVWMGSRMELVHPSRMELLHPSRIDILHPSCTRVHSQKLKREGQPCCRCYLLCFVVGTRHNKAIYIHTHKSEHVDIARALTSHSQRGKGI